MDFFPIISTILTALAVILLIILLLRKPEVGFVDRVRTEVDRVSETLRQELRISREENAGGARQFREEMGDSSRALTSALTQRVADDAAQQLAHFQTFSSALTESSERGELRLSEMRKTLEERLQTAAEAQHQADAITRSELQAGLKTFGNAQTAALQELAQTLRLQLSELTTRNEAKLEQMRTTVETKLAQVQSDNEEKLERIRATVDEKLHATLEQRLGESFRLVSERLEQVHTGLGEMKSLATGVGDLKKILSNVKTRGTWGEVQLGNLLEQTLTKDQFTRNFAPDPNSGERVEFAIKLPGRDDDGTPVWLPIDSKFPHEDYQRLLEAQERADLVAADAASAALEAAIRLECRKIRDKYLRTPVTTDFAILFLPTEALFAEVLRRPGLSEALQRDYRVVVSGPTTLTALLTSLQMGFRTLAIEKHSGKVWKVLGAVKTEFGKFGAALDKVQKKLNEASNAVEDAKIRSRAMERQLKPADELPAADAVTLLGLSPDPVPEDTGTASLFPEEIPEKTEEDEPDRV
jgi:DNA recombination protein RmuC